MLTYAGLMEHELFLTPTACVMSQTQPTGYSWFMVWEAIV